MTSYDKEPGREEGKGSSWSTPTAFMASSDVPAVPPTNIGVSGNDVEIIRVGINLVALGDLSLTYVLYL